MNDEVFPQWGWAHLYITSPPRIMDEVGSPFAGISGKAMNGVLHGFLLASSFSMFLKLDSRMLQAASASPATFASIGSMGRASLTEGVLGAKLVGAPH